jgi:hypothetical protein
VHSGKKSGVLQKLLLSKLGLTVHTDKEQQAPPGWTLSSPCGGGAAAAAFVAFKRVRCCTWTLNLLHRRWGRHCCFSKKPLAISLSLTLQNPRVSQVTEMQFPLERLKPIRLQSISHHHSLWISWWKNPSSLAIALNRWSREHRTFFFQLWGVAKLAIIYMKISPNLAMDQVWK